MLIFWLNLEMACSNLFMKIEHFVLEPLPFILYLLIEDGTFCTRTSSGPVPVLSSSRTGLGFQRNMPSISTLVMFSVAL